jgi:hypothetical protein
VKDARYLNFLPSAYRRKFDSRRINHNTRLHRFTLYFNVIAIRPNVGRHDAAGIPGVRKTLPRHCLDRDRPMPH